MTIPYKPLTTRVVLEQNKKVAKTPGGIIIPDTVASDVKIATIKAVGPDVTSLKEGDKVSYSLEPTRGITVDGKKYFLMYETEIDGIFQK
jgi:chaperonin GroES